MHLCDKLKMFINETDVNLKWPHSNIPSHEETRYIFLTVLNHRNPAKIQLYFNKPQASFTEALKKPSHKLTGYNNEEINQVLSKSVQMA